MVGELTQPARDIARSDSDVIPLRDLTRGFWPLHRQNFEGSVIPYRHPLARLSHGEIHIGELGHYYAGYHSLDYNYRLGEWYQIRIDWGSSGDFVVEIYGEDGSLLDGPLVGNDSRWSSGGIGFNSAGTADEVYDYVVLE